jgi:hypothetical protein
MTFRKSIGRRRDSRRRKFHNSGTLNWVLAAIVGGEIEEPRGCSFDRARLYVGSRPRPPPDPSRWCLDSAERHHTAGG